MKLPVSSRNEVYSKSGSKRLNYFAGQLLTAEGLRTEQEYFIEKLCQHNRAAFDVGIIKGLTITCRGKHVSVRPGFAMDIASRLVELPMACNFNLPSDNGTWDIILGLVEVQVDPAPSIDNIDANNGQNFYNIQEHIKLWIQKTISKKEENVPATAIMLGRISAKNGQCQVVKTTDKK